MTMGSIKSLKPLPSTDEPQSSVWTRIEQALHKPLILVIILSVLIVASIRALQVNNTDNLFQSRANWNVYANHRFPHQDPIEMERTVYGHPAHTAFLTAPFLMFGAHLAAFFNVSFIMILLIGEKRGWAALATMAFIFSPPVIYVFAAVNMPGVTTALGLIFLLAGKRSPMRGYAWAMMASRPQDSLLTLMWDGLRAVWQRDWGAFLFAAGLMLPTFVTLGHWLSILPTSSTELAINPAEFYTLSLPINIGVLPAVLIVAAIVGWRLTVITLASGRPAVRLRSLETITLTERFWLVYVVWLLLMPYFLLYVLWVMMLPLRLYSPARTLLAFVLVMVIGALTLSTIVYTGSWFGALLVTLVFVFLTPKTGITETVPPQAA